MTKTKFNLLRYQELKEYMENTPEELLKTDLVFEFLDLQSSITDQLSYERRHAYCDLIQKYLAKKFDIEVFLYEFRRLRKEDEKKSKKILDNFKQLSNFWIDSDLEDFHYALSEINDLCCYVNELGVADDDLSEENFYDSTKDWFFILQKSLEK